MKHASHAFCFTALCLILYGCGTMKSTNGIPNLAKVDDGIYRGGQPTAEGWQWLKAKGITNVIKLNPESEASEKTAVDLGFNIRRFPIDIDDQIFGTPWNALNAAQAIDGGPVFVHCSHGQDRTGLTIAIYRVQHDGWPKPTAEEEMLTNGFHKDLIGLWGFWNKHVK